MRPIRLAALAALCALTAGACAQAQVTPETAAVAQAPAPAAAPMHGLPDGQGKDAVQIACTQCHGVDVITRQPRGRDEWTEVVARMIGAGAQLGDDDYDLVINYLATHLGPGQAAPAGAHPTPAVPEAKPRT